jgi:hypothetical protein
MVSETVKPEYRVSQRVTLVPGTRFRARGGPFIVLTSGVKASLAAKGPFTFKAHHQRGKYEWIEALDKTGQFAPLHIAGRRKRVTPALVPRPYKITSVVRKKKGTRNG